MRTPLLRVQLHCWPVSHIPGVLSASLGVDLTRPVPCRVTYCGCHPGTALEQPRRLHFEHKHAPQGTSAALNSEGLARAKVKFLSESDAAGELSFIPPDVLPEIFGGKAPLLPVDEAVRKFGLLKAPLRSTAKACYLYHAQQSKLSGRCLPRTDHAWAPQTCRVTVAAHSSLHTAPHPLRLPPSCNACVHKRA